MLFFHFSFLDEGDDNISIGSKTDTASSIYGNNYMAGSRTSIGSAGWYGGTGTTESGHDAARDESDSERSTLGGEVKKIKNVLLQISVDGILLILHLRLIHMDLLFISFFTIRIYQGFEEYLFL